MASIEKNKDGSSSASVPKHDRAGSAAESSESEHLGKKYQRKTDIQHVLEAPDTYIGSVEATVANTWTCVERGERGAAESEQDQEKSSPSIVSKSITYVPALLKLFDEAIINARDHAVRMNAAIEQCKSSDGSDHRPVTKIDVCVNEETGAISICNDGDGIDVAEHPTEKKMIPELIFGHLRTSTNYNKDEQKITGGKNGYGVKLCFIWSTHGELETIDHRRGLKYRQEFKANLSEIGKPAVTKNKGKPYTKITFTPDYERMGCTLNAEVVALLKRRVYDIAAVTSKNVKVTYNGSPVEVRTFAQYIDLYLGPKAETPRVYEQFGEHWEVAVARAPAQEFTQVSFVNGIHTSKGGRHVDYIVEQLTHHIVALIEKKKKVKVTPASIKEQLFVFVRCNIVNPSFDSQSKEYLTTSRTKFGSLCAIPPKFIEKVAAMGVMDQACRISDAKADKAASKKADGAKTKTITGIPKLSDANFAGGSKSPECALILAEGDSARAGIVSGMSPADRDVFGVYPMKGKILNPHGKKSTVVAKNDEICDLMKIMGLKMGVKYTAESAKQTLRYGRIIFMTDQDLDGSHIKGLGIWLIFCLWPELADIPGFIGFMNTPIITAKHTQRKNEEKTFYSMVVYNQWRAELEAETALNSPNSDLNRWKIKYYKGLGTSTGAEFRKYFADKKFIGFKKGESEEDVKKSVDAMDLAFNDGRADDRKVWVRDIDNNACLDTETSAVTFDAFVNQDLVHYSKYNCARGIPSIMDGFKPSQRKVLFACFKRKLTSEIKVAQLGGYVSEHSAYHHGEMSLFNTIINMAQTFVGSNNVNLLSPNGQFGTRIMGGSDSASPRYIFTCLMDIARRIFHADDDAILNTLVDDGMPIEPEYYAPIVPMLLVNGSVGIGTGYSTDIPLYNIRDVLKLVKAWIMKSANASSNTVTGTSTGNADELTPYYRGFKGSIRRIADVCDKNNADIKYAKFLSVGVYTVVDREKETIRITELPIGMWTMKAKQHYESLIDAGANSNSNSSTNSNSNASTPIVKSVSDNSTDQHVLFTIVLCKGELAKLEAKNIGNGCNGVHEVFKLTNTISTSNMHAFGADGKLTKYNTIGEIVHAFALKRQKLYVDRIAKLLQTAREEETVVDNKMKYIMGVLEDKIDLRRKSAAEIEAMMKANEIQPDKETNTYTYLTRMPMHSVTQENVDKLKREQDNIKAHIAFLTMSTPESIWLDDLSMLEEALDKMDTVAAAQEAESAADTAATSEAKPKNKAQKGKAGAKVKSGSDGVKKIMTAGVKRPAPEPSAATATTLLNTTNNVNAIEPATKQAKKQTTMLQFQC